MREPVQKRLAIKFGDAPALGILLATPQLSAAEDERGISEANWRCVPSSGFDHPATIANSR